MRRGVLARVVVKVAGGSGSHVCHSLPENGRWVDARVVRIAYLVLLRLSTIVVSVPLGFAVQLGIFMAVLVTTAAFLFFEHSEA